MRCLDVRSRAIIGTCIVLCGFQVNPPKSAGSTPFPATLIMQINSPGVADFGFSTADLNGNLLVGARDSGINSAAYLMNIGNGAQILKVTSPDAGNGSVSFGDAVAPIGQNFVVTDYEYRVGSTVRIGSAYVFDGTTGQNLLTIRNPNPSSNAFFGASVQSVGGNLWINSESGDTTRSGEVYSFNPANGQLLNTISNPESGTGNFGFGFKMLEHQGSAFISAIGAPVSGFNPGAVYRYDTGTLTETAKISAPNPQLDSDFGYSLAQNGSLLLVGSMNSSTSTTNDVGRAYLFNSDTGTLLQTFSDPEPKQSAGFGTSVALLGTYAFVGAPFADLNPGGTIPQNVGAIYVFDVNTGNYLGRIVDPAGQQNDQFTLGQGTGGGLSVIGDELFASSYLRGAGSVYVYSVPEPATLALLTLGTLGLLARRSCKADRV